MKKIFKKKFPIPSWIFAMFMVAYGEILLQLWTAEPLVPGRLLAVGCFGLAFGGVLSVIISFLPKKAEKPVTIVMSAIYSILCLLEYFIHDAYHTFMPFSVVLAGAEGVANGFLGTVLALLWNNLWRIGLILLPVILYGVFAKQVKATWKIRGVLVGATAGLYLLSILVVNFVSGDAKRFEMEYNFDGAVEAFGVSISLPLDVIRTSVGEDAPEFVTPTKTEPTQPTKTEPTAESTQATEVEETEPPVVYVENKFDLDFAALAEAEPHPAIAALHSYVAAQTPSMQHEYTGLFEGKNLILITAEAFSDEVIDPVRTPTLYRMATEGIHFKDYYQPVWGAGTTGGEFTNVVGLSPTGGGCMQESRQQDLFLTMGNQLQKLGYTSAAFHNNDYTYYERHRTHELLGYDVFMGYGNGIEEGVTAQWPESDLEMFAYTIPQYIDKSPFSLYYMTVSGHSSYSQGSNAMSKKNYDLVKDMECSETLKCYFAANMELELSMEYLLGELEKAGIADDTVVVIAADHYPYGLESSSTWGTSKDYLRELYGESPSTFVQDNNALIIWSGCLEDMDLVVEDPVFSLDILPTLSNLFGVDYDSRLLVGRDVLSDTPALVFWHSYYWKTDKGSYDAGSGTFTPNEGVEVDDGYVAYISSVVKDKITYSRSVQRDNYFNYVTAALEAMNQSSTEPTEATE